MGISESFFVKWGWRTNYIGYRCSTVKSSRVITKWRHKFNGVRYVFTKFKLLTVLTWFRTKAMTARIINDPKMTPSMMDQCSDFSATADLTNVGFSLAIDWNKYDKLKLRDIVNMKFDFKQDRLKNWGGPKLISLTGPCKP